MASLIERNVERERRLFDRADGVVVLTEWALRAVEANLGATEKLHLNRLGIASDRFEPKRERTTVPPLRLGYLGRFDPIKGVLVLARALARLPRDLELSVELRGPSGTDTEKRARAMCAGDPRIRFGPPVAPAEVAAVLAGYDVLLCPSIALEGGPTVALEAHAVGTPVVGSRIGGLAEIVEDGATGRLLPPGDVQALESSIIELVKHPDLVDRWRRRLPVPRTMDEVARDYVKLYQSRSA
jgi:glycosyltransferase involved in cell wall biosynthesis